MLVRAHADTTCLMCNLETGGSRPSDLKSSVGVGGANKRADVLAAQQLLNGVTADDGGPVPLLAEDGIDGPKTNAAIKAFQSRQKLKVVDGRIDPDGPTIHRLNDVSTPGQRALALLRALLGGAVPSNAKNLGGLAPTVRHALRLRRVGLAMPELIAAAAAGMRAAEQAMDDITFARSSAASRKAEFYFAFGRQPPARTQDELAFIRTTFSRVQTVLLAARPSVFGGNPFGAAIFAIDPLNRTDWRAYSPMQLADAKRHDGVSSGHIYLCDRIDFDVQDLFRHILFHELCHFVDDESKERRIVDANNGYREGALKLTHEQRMHNSDNYALFASHIAFGRARLVASQPSLAAVVPADMP
jgi:peptidoglycan hydrolase-like protein with peptidoglycan-binding domain